MSTANWQKVLTLPARGRGFYLITKDVEQIVAEGEVTHGLCNVFLRHTSASVLISENADPAVRRDLEHFMQRLAPDGDPMFEHDTEGPDDMPAHVRSVLTGVSLTIPVQHRKLLLGTWQGIYLWEHRLKPQRREVVVTVLGS